MLINVFFIAYHLYYADKIIKGVYVLNLAVEDKTVEGAFHVLHDHLNPRESIIVKVGDFYKKEIKPGDIGFKYLYVKTAQDAFKKGRERFFLTDLKEKFFGLNNKIVVEPSYEYDTQKLSDIVSDIQLNAGKVMKEPAFILNADGNIDIIDGKDGLYIDSVELADNIVFAFNPTLDIAVEGTLKVRKPILTMTDLDIVKPAFEKVFKKDFNIKYGDSSWILSKEQLLNMVIPIKDKERMVLSVDDSFLTDLINNLSAEIDRSPKAQKLKIEDGKLIEFESSTDGLSLNKLESKKRIKEAILSDVTNVELSVVVNKAYSSDNQYGIKELVGIGKSKFAHSSTGRIHNVGLAASRVSGTLIPPGDVFSFNNAVGEISRKTGYTAAWVISKGRTVLGDGGGVCQVSTTMFRAALDAGLPIVERKAHSYRVGYYEQDSAPGIDATIYSPSVDLKFKNDTDNYILIVADFDKDAKTLVFKLYGTKDNRVVEMTAPKILSRRAPPAAVYEEDPTRAKGSTVRIESPVSGANVVFTRKVTKNNVILYDDTFKSNYRAWGAVYKIGTKE